ncbi:hypothetical protein NHQ30_006301 [Ciborinia camelliae]|nr:hypothetical protein NHQ30_006301 [Ciborinia camelliae]
MSSTTINNLEPVPLDSTGEAPVASSVQLLPTNLNFPSNPTSAVDGGTTGLQTDPASSTPVSIPEMSAPIETLLGWMKYTEIKASLLSLVIALLGLVITVIYGTSTWIQSSNAANATAKANQLALFTACISFPDQPNIVNSTFCRTNRNASLDGFTKRDTAAISLPLLWDIDAFAEVLQIVQPSWNCESGCDKKATNHLPNLAQALSFSTFTRENCRVDCFERTQSIFWVKHAFKKLWPLFIVFFMVSTLKIARKHFSTRAISTTITYACAFLFLASWILGTHQTVYERFLFILNARDSVIINPLTRMIIPSKLSGFWGVAWKPRVWLNIVGFTFLTFNILERGPFTIDTSLLLGLQSSVHLREKNFELMPVMSIQETMWSPAAGPLSQLKHYPHIF